MEQQLVEVANVVFVSYVLLPEMITLIGVNVTELGEVSAVAPALNDTLAAR